MYMYIYVYLWTYEAKCTSPGAVCVQWGGDFCHWPRPRCLDHT